MKKILIVDDSLFMRTILKDLLMDKSDSITIEEPIKIYEADGKVGALTQLKITKPDVILLDIVMRESETEGLEFLSQIKDTYDTKKIIIVSSIGQSSILQQCEKLGISGYVKKPFERQQVIEAVNRILKS